MGTKKETKSNTKTTNLINKKDYFHYTQCGLDNIYLKNGYNIKETKYGMTYSINSADELHEFIADSIITNPTPIRGQEFRFLRSMMQLSQRLLAERIGLSRSAIARYEATAEEKVPNHVDKSIRFFYSLIMEDNEDAEKLRELLRELDDLKDQEFFSF